MALETPRLHMARVGPRIAWRDLLFKAGPLIALVALIAYLSIASPKFGSHANFMNIGRQTAPLAMIAIGQTFVILTGGIDLSVAAIAAFASAVTAVLMTAPLHLFGVDFGYLPIPLCIAAGLLVGLIAGIINGLIISTFHIPDFIATLGTMQVFRGVALLTTDGQSVPGPTSTREMPDAFSWWLGSATFGGVPISIFIVLVAAAIAVYALNFRALGRAVYAVGGNREAARVCGISIGRTKVYVYAISGVLAAIGGVSARCKVERRKRAACGRGRVAIHRVRGYRRDEFLRRRRRCDRVAGWRTFGRRAWQWAEPARSEPVLSADRPGRRCRARCGFRPVAPARRITQLIGGRSLLRASEGSSQGRAAVRTYRLSASASRPNAVSLSVAR